METINRREALKRASWILGGALSSSLVTGVLSGQTLEPPLNWTPRALKREQVRLVEDLTERLLPATATPGAREAQVVRFIDRMIAEFLRDSERETFFRGLEYLQQQGFSKQGIPEQDRLVRELAVQARNQRQGPEGKPFFLLFKELTVLGFFTSEVGATQVLNYDPIPGGFQGCRTLEEVGGKTWAT